jgi:2-polyprenyl-3-methyl-5-hydroxy-6-metoxy-1,4-benzoquinol methylase/uncharacterized protein YbaR (Trm112 family)
MDLLVCPVCRGRLRLHVISEAPQAVAGPVLEPRCATYCARHGQTLKPGANGTANLDCRDGYTNDIREGFLECSSCHLLYPILEGVPRVIRNAYEEYKDFFYRHSALIGNLQGQAEVAGRLGRLKSSVFDRRSNESFGLQWQMYQYEDKTWFKDDADLRRQEFLYNMDLTEEQLRGKLILDAGCGNGRLTASVARYGAEVVGMDLSRSVERADKYRALFAQEHAPFVHFVQGNVMEPPFARETFDHIHTSGVLHHTPAPQRAFEIFLTLVRPGGKAYVQLYRKREAWVGIPNQMLRAFTCRLPVRLLYRLCYLTVPLHTTAVLVVAHFRGEKSPIREASRRERAVSLFDHFSPRYQFRYTPEQVHQMFKKAGLRNIKDVTLANEARHMVAFVGDK